MSETTSHWVTAADFLGWDLAQPSCRHELVDGVPRALTGARVGHDLIVGNAATALRNRLRAAVNPSNVFSADIAVVVHTGNVRRPDVAINCPPYDIRATTLNNPKLIIEVLSDSIDPVDQIVKLEEYRAIDSLETIIVVAPYLIEVGVWDRDQAGPWQSQVLRERGTIIDLPRLAIALPLADIYDRIDVSAPTDPRLAWPDPH